MPEANLGMNDAQSRPAISRCCHHPVMLWTHHVETRAGETTRHVSTVICSACRMPADGSRPEEVAADMPWHLIARAV